MLNRSNSVMAPVIIPGNDFMIVPAVTPEQLQEAYRLKYLVYCVERGYESPVMYPDGYYSDVYDTKEKSDWILIVHKETGIAVGTTRVIRDTPPTRNRPYSLRCEHVADISHLRKMGSVVELSSVLFSSGNIPKSKYLSRIEMVRHEMGLNLGYRENLFHDASSALTCGFFFLVHREKATSWCALMDQLYGRSLRRIINLTTDGVVHQDHGSRCLYTGFREESLRKNTRCRSLYNAICDVIAPFTTEQVVTPHQTLVSYA